MNSQQFFYETYRKFQQDNQHQRMGQFYYNQFRDRFPHIEVPEEADCFYDDKKLGDFCIFVGNLTL